MHSSLYPAARRITGQLSATPGYVVGIEINGSGSRQAVALADLQGNIIHRVRRPVEYVADTSTVLQALTEMFAEVTASEYVENGRILRIGVAVSGIVDATQGIVRTLHHAHGWHNFRLQDYLEEKLDVSCIIDNDANGIALAETCLGAGRGEHVVLYISLGRWIASGLVVNGSIYRGSDGLSGEIGHMQVKEHGLRCSCGGNGHLNTVASAQAIVRTMIGLSVEHPETEVAIRRVTGARAERITVEQVFRLAADGDRVAQAVVDDVLSCLSVALTNIMYIINPSMIILGGPVAQAGPLFIVPLQERIRLPGLEQFTQPLRIVQSTYGSEANLVGAIALALQGM